MLKDNTPFIEKKVEEFDILIYNQGIKGGVTSSSAIELKDNFRTALTEALEQGKEELRDNSIEKLYDIWHEHCSEANISFPLTEIRLALTNKADNK